MSAGRNRILMLITLGQSGSIHSTDMPWQKTSVLFLKARVTDFQDVSWQPEDTAFHLLSASHRQEQSYHGDDRGRKTRSRC